MRKKLVTKNINVGVVVLVFIISCCVLHFVHFVHFVCLSVCLRVVFFEHFIFLIAV